LTLQAAPALGFAGANSLLANPHPPDFFSAPQRFQGVITIWTFDGRAAMAAVTLLA
jgi:hypothetical protein